METDMLMRQKDAAQFLRVTVQTVRNYEKAGLIRRIARPGAWYNSRDLSSLAGGNLHVVQSASEENAQNTEERR